MREFVILVFIKSCFLSELSKISWCSCIYFAASSFNPSFPASPPSWLPWMQWKPLQLSLHRCCIRLWWSLLWIHLHVINTQLYLWALQISQRVKRNECQFSQYLLSNQPRTADILAVLCYRYSLYSLLSLYSLFSVIVILAILCYRYTRYSLLSLYSLFSVRGAWIIFHFSIVKVHFIFC